MSHPNILLLAGRQHRHDCTGYAGHPVVKTPNLDALARGGAWFHEAQAPVAAAREALPALVNAKALERLRTAGYRLGYAGPPLDHMEAFHTARTAPLPGVTESSTHYEHWLAEHNYADRAVWWAGDGIVEAPSSYRQQYGAIRSVFPEQAHVTAWLGNQAAGFVRSALEPFCLVVCFTRPGEPYDPPAMREQGYPEDSVPLPPDCTLPVPPETAAACRRFDFGAMTAPALRRALAHYYASITMVDQQVGRILATVQARGLTRNLIAYTALGGELAGHHGLMGVASPGQYPIVQRAPLIVAGAAGLEPGPSPGYAGTGQLAAALVHTALDGAWPEAALS